MYIEYTTPQRVADSNYTEYDSKGGDYRPTWLIRTDDWQKVPGYEATDGYHTLSYCWEQSGEKFLKADGEYGLTDDGHHRVTKITANKPLSTCSSKCQRRPEMHVTKEVTYDELVQQVCKDFGIEYLWYDKICINQSNKEEKHHEIKQMHLIYSNARYTVALVPEINIDDPEDFDYMNWVSKDTGAKVTALRQMLMSLWWKRSWTLEEVMMSTRILVVGRNTHFWSLASFKQGKKQHESDILSGIMLGFKERKMKSANQVLRYAHPRTSTKPHDRIYALANIFNGIVDIDVDYSIDVSTVMNSFYRQLARKDLSLICFGSNLLPDGEAQYATAMDSYGLPSWTGIFGLHTSRPTADITLDQNCDYTIDDNMRLHMQCRSYTIRPTKYKDNIDAFTNDERKKKANNNYVIKVISSMDDFDGNESEALDWSQWCMLGATGCFPTHYYKPDDHVPFLPPILPLSLTEECDECVILGVLFDSVISSTIDFVFAGYGHFYLSPVARKSTDGPSYKIIGVVLLKHFKYYEPRPTAQEVMDRMFGNLGCESQNFFIE